MGTGETQGARGCGALFRQNREGRSRLASNGAACIDQSHVNKPVARSTCTVFDGDVELDGCCLFGYFRGCYGDAILGNSETAADCELYFAEDSRAGIPAAVVVGF